MENFWKNLPKGFSVLAPMEDVTDVVFRQVVREIGRPDVFFTEFTNVDGMNSKGRERVITRLRKQDQESPIVAQIWGRTPENYLKAAQDVVEMGFDGVDINMGCPVRKIVKNVTCSAFIDHPELAKEVIAATKEGAAGRIPVSVKTRLGFKTKKTEEWSRLLLEQGIDVLTMHGRIAKDMSKFPADWNEIKKVVEIRDQMGLETLVIGNGDVLSLDEVKQKTEETGVDGVMIGRGVFQDPFVFNPNRKLDDLDLEQRLALIKRHTDLFTETWGDSKPFVILRRFFKIYLHGLENSNEIKARFMETESQQDVHQLVQDLT